MEAKATQKIEGVLITEEQLKKVYTNCKPDKLKLY